MNRIDALFSRYRAEQRKTLVGYLTAGDPDMATSEANIRTALDHGVDLLELGVPFSDPTADGPTIQEAARRALRSGVRLADVLDLVSRLRADYQTPIVLFGYVNPLFRYGYDAACRDAAAAGADGLLVVDLPFEMWDELQGPAGDNGLVLIPLVAPTTPPERAARLLAAAKGFVYYIMVKGVTGARTTLASDLASHVDTLRGVTELPIAAGFGVSTGELAAKVAAVADGVVVGSALVRAATEGETSLASLVDELRRGIDGVAS